MYSLLIVISINGCSLCEGGYSRIEADYVTLEYCKTKADEFNSAISSNKYKSSKAYCNKGSTWYVSDKTFSF